MASNQRKSLVLITTKDRIKSLTNHLETRLEQVSSYAKASSERKELIADCKDAIENIKLELEMLEAVLEN